MKNYFLCLAIFLPMCASASAQANWLSNFTGWCGDNKQIVAGAGIIAGGLFANQILKVCTKRNRCHFLAVKEAYSNKDFYADVGYTCYPVKQIAHKDGKETCEIFINSGVLNPFHHYAARTYKKEKNKILPVFDKDTMHKEFKPFVKNAFIGLGLLAMFKGQTKFW